MKKVLFILSLVASTSAIYAQEEEATEFDKWSIELSAGVNKPTRTFTPGYFVNTPSVGQGALGVRYMFNNKFGLKLEGGYSNIEGDEESYEFTTTNYRGSLQGVINLGNVLDFNKWTNTFGLLVHAGGGYSMNVYDEDIVGTDFDNDNMLHIMGGITPQVRLSNSIALTADVTAMGNIRQRMTWDGASLNSSNGVSNENRGVDAFIVNASLGLTFYLGSNEKHADWVADDTVLKDKVMELEERLAKIESDLIDSDQDGVADYLDREPNTVSGVSVNTKGVAVDKNKNGIPDEIEGSLEARYLNKDDYKPSPNTVTNGSVIKDLLEKGYVNVYFKTNSSTPEKYSLEAVNYLKTYLIQNPSASAQLIGYADEIGNEAYNAQLSEKRAKRVYDILVASGIDANRLSHTGNGEDTSVDKNSSEARQLVRRVTFKLN
ncbi:OmpA domain protein [unidentified eubacterium SCB49]|nr:OmpA domain protein [unidentified eubacterium SCB49]